MSGFHQRMRAMTIRRLGVGRGGVGVKLTYNRITPGEYNDETGLVENDTVVQTVGSGVRVNYKDSAYRNEDIVYGDFQIYMSPVDEFGADIPKPNVGDTLTFIQDTVRIINVYPFNDNGFDCGWKLQVRYG